jgi:predicted Zn-dependent protease
MTDTAIPQLSSALPRELAAELLALARAAGAEFADLYAEHAIITGFSLDERRVKSASYTVLRGVGVRAIRGEQTGYAYADGFAPDALREAARVAAAVARDPRPAGTGATGAPVAFRVTEGEPPFVLRDPARSRSTRRRRC